jgi:hypothetical protein
MNSFAWFRVHQTRFYLVTQLEAGASYRSAAVCDDFGQLVIVGVQ